MHAQVFRTERQNQKNGSREDVCVHMILLCNLSGAERQQIKSLGENSVNYYTKKNTNSLKEI